MKSISLIVPVWNESSNITSLVKRIHKTLKGELKYEIIFIDDHSSDNTKQIISSLQKQYPIKVFDKNGSRGKAQSLIEGFPRAKYELIGMIDADLQYPPENIPDMVDQIEKGFDIVVADRQEHRTSLARKIASNTFKLLFGKLLHGFSQDIQSGLKVFKKEIVERITLESTGWAFDLEFLIKARNAGYTIVSIPIIFENRTKGKTKVNMFFVSLQLIASAVRLKFLIPQIVPFHATTEQKKGKGFHYKGQEFVHHSALSHHSSALYTLSRKQGVVLVLVMALVLLFFILNWYESLLVLVILITIFYFIDLLFNFILISRSFSNSAEIQITDAEIGERDLKSWPKYTIFCPLYKEWAVVPQFVEAIQKLNYPSDKLEVMLLLEEEDTETIKEIKKFRLPKYFSIIIVPNSKPKTKPKACNYGLIFATGEYVVIYDAEDVPEPNQLKKAVLAFENTNKKVVCIQAKLNFYNPHQNILTRVFTAEYSLWFDLILIGLQSVNVPIPLGGTSNHFRKKDLIHLDGWDSFNVTEDCDLGIRLAKHGYETQIVNSLTLEEANSDFINWFWQRTRWIKGYFQTYLVHMRNPKSFLKKGKFRHFFGFQIIVGGKVFSMLINPLMWIITIAYFAQRTTLGPLIESFFPGPILYIGVVSLVAGNFLYLYYYMIGCAKRETYSLIKFAFLVPFYWLAMSVAAWIAIYKLIREPHFWSKTKHGLHITAQPVSKVINNSFDDGSDLSNRISSVLQALAKRI